jgi:hypothetical protein
LLSSTTSIFNTLRLHGRALRVHLQHGGKKAAL